MLQCIALEYFSKEMCYVTYSLYKTSLMVDNFQNDVGGTLKVSSAVETTNIGHPTTAKGWL
jgi:hypothetical protein